MIGGTADDSAETVVAGLRNPVGVAPTVTPNLTGSGEPFRG